MKVFTVFAVFLLLCLIGYVLIECSRPVQHTFTPMLGKKDSIYINKDFKPVEVVQPIQPAKVKIYLPDTVKRKEAERGNIIRQVQIKKNVLEITRITPASVTITNEIALPGDIPELVIDADGMVQISPEYYRRQKRKKIWRTVKTVGVGIASFTLAAWLSQ